MSPSPEERASIHATIAPPAPSEAIAGKNWLPDKEARSIPQAVQLAKLAAGALTMKSRTVSTTIQR